MYPIGIYKALAAHRFCAAMVVHLVFLVFYGAYYRWRVRRWPAAERVGAWCGDPAKGDYDFVGKFPASYTVPLHWHSNDCVVVMRSGAMTISRPGEADVTIAEGGLFELPAKAAYTAHCQAACEFLVHGTAPFDIIYSDSEGRSAAGAR